jgi:hypothetical protein
MGKCICIGPPSRGIGHKVESWGFLSGSWRPANGPELSDSYPQAHVMQPLKMASPLEGGVEFLLKNAGEG